jgi:hypothetical protein
LQVLATSCGKTANRDVPLDNVQYQRALFWKEGYQHQAFFNNAEALFFIS